MPQGTVSKIRYFSDFGGSVAPFGTGGVGTEVVTFTVDEPGGVLQLQAGSTDNDNAFVVAQGFKPADGPILMETRVKIADIAKGAYNIGFTDEQDILAASTYVLGVEFATASATTNDADAALFFYDIDATTDTWRFMTVKAAVDGDITVVEAPVNDTWAIFRVEIDPTGDVRAFYNDELIASESEAVTPTDTLHAIVAQEARGTSEDSPVEIDYLLAEGYRDWTP